MHPCQTNECPEFVEGRKKFCPECKRRKHNAQDSSRYMATAITRRDMLEMDDIEYRMNSLKLLQSVQRDAV